MCFLVVVVVTGEYLTVYRSRYQVWRGVPYNRLGKLVERLGTYMYTSVEWSTSLFSNLECKQPIASAIQIGIDRWIVGQARGNLVGTENFRLSGLGPHSKPSASSSNQIAWR